MPAIMHLWLYILNTMHLRDNAVATIPALRGCGEQLKTSIETKPMIPSILPYPTLYFGNGRCELSDHTWATYLTIRRCWTPPPPPPTPGNPHFPAAPPTPPLAPRPGTPLPAQGASGQQLVGGVVDVQNRATPPPPRDASQAVGHMSWWLWC